MYFFERTLPSRDYHYILLVGDLANDKPMKGEYFIRVTDPFELAWTKIAEIKIIINISIIINILTYINILICRIALHKIF